MERPDSGMRGKVCLVIGGSSGIGWATALGLANTDATVIVLGRGRSRAEAIVAESNIIYPPVALTAC